VTGYGQYCPIALGAEVFAERWTPIILRNLMTCERFGDILAGAPGLPRSVLAKRLRSLERAGVVARCADGRGPAYRLTACGEELAEVCLALGTWGARWRESLPEHHDPYLVVWMLSRMIHLDELPRRRVVVRFDVPGTRSPNRFWLVVGSGEREVCVNDPGYGDDAVVTCDTATLVAWHCGRLTLGQAQRDGRMRVVATPADERMLDGWGRLSPFAGVTPAVIPPVDLRIAPPRR
jgi:DNA-binding HxlR family transcriptional regulator